MEHLYNYSLEELTEYFKSINEKPFRAKQVFQWLYQKNAFDFQEMSNISKDLREKLEKQCIIDTFEIQEKQVSSDGTIKYLFKMIDGNLIEAVLMRHDYGQSLCVTSQVGCNMQCAFCASGLLKKQRNLTAGEMVNQVMAVTKDTGIRVSHVVVMGTGEPFDNYDEVMKFVRIINHPHGLAIGARHITISTCGLVNMIERYSNEGIQTNLAISLHSGKWLSSCQRAMTCQCRCGTMLPNWARFTLCGRSALMISSSTTLRMPQSSVLSSDVSEDISGTCRHETTLRKQGKAGSSASMR